MRAGNRLNGQISFFAPYCALSSPILPRNTRYHLLCCLNVSHYVRRKKNCDLFTTAVRQGRSCSDLSTPEEKWTNESGWVDLWAAPRGYAVYVPA